MAPAQILEDIFKLLVSNGDKLGAVAILLLVLAVVVVGFQRGYLPDPVSLERERTECREKADLMAALTKEAQDGAVNYAVAKVNIEYRQAELDRCNARIRELEAMGHSLSPGQRQADV